MRCSSTLLLALLSSAPLACGSDDQKAPASATTTARTWERIIEGKWSLPPGGEEERGCYKKLLTEDVYVSAIRPVHPLGTHHTLLTLGDEKSECTTAVVNGLIYAGAAPSERRREVRERVGPSAPCPAV
jgi:hypothetical protein